MMYSCIHLILVIKSISIDYMSTLICYFTSKPSYVMMEIERVKGIF